MNRSLSDRLHGLPWPALIGAAVMLLLMAALTLLADPPQGRPARLQAQAHYDGARFRITNLDRGEWRFVEISVTSRNGRLLSWRRLELLRSGETVILPARSGPDPGGERPAELAILTGTPYGEFRWRGIREASPP